MSGEEKPIRRHAEIVEVMTKTLEEQVRTLRDSTTRAGVDWEERKLACRVIRRTAELLTSIAEEGDDAPGGLDEERLDKAFLRHWRVLAQFVETFDPKSWPEESGSVRKVRT